MSCARGFSRTGRVLRGDRRGAVFVEKLIVYLPLLCAFFATWELAELSAAALVVQRASAAAGRAAVVVLPDDPAFYEGEAIGAFAGRRKRDIELAAGMVLSAVPRLGADFSVEVPDAPDGVFDVQVRAPFDCGLVSLVCGGDGELELSSTTQHAYQGARYAFVSPTQIDTSSQALATTSRTRKRNDRGNDANARDAGDACESHACRTCREVAQRHGVKGANATAIKPNLDRHIDDLNERLAGLRQARGNVYTPAESRQILALEDDIDELVEAWRGCHSCQGKKLTDQCDGKEPHNIREYVRYVDAHQRDFCAKGATIAWAGGGKANEGAIKYAEQVHGQTLAQTPGGIYLDKKLENWKCHGLTMREEKQVWDAASRRLLECATGEVHFIQDCDKLDAPRDDAFDIWKRVEYPAAKRNSKVTAITPRDLDGNAMGAFCKGLGLD